MGKQVSIYDMFSRNPLCPGHSVYSLCRDGCSISNPDVRRRK